MKKKQLLLVRVSLSTPSMLRRETFQNIRILKTYSEILLHEDISDPFLYN